jgi:L-fuconolactonase
MSLKIDAHQHFWRFNPDEYGWIDDSMVVLKRDFLPGDLQPLLLQEGFDGSIAVQARQTLQETEWLLELAGRYDFIKGVVGWVDLCSDDLEDQLEPLSHHKKLAGLRYVIQDEPDDDYMLRSDFQRGLGKLALFKLAYDILIFPRHLPQTIRLVGNFPDQTFILDHLAKPSIRTKEICPWKQHIELLAGYPNVYCKLSGMVTEADWHSWKPDDFRQYMDTVVNAFGTGRIMIGSDWPVCTLAGVYNDIIGLVKKYFLQFSGSELEMLLGANAIKAYSLPC